MSNANQSYRRAAGRLGIVAAFLLPVCAGFASSAHALDNGVSLNSGELKVNAAPGSAWFEYQLSYEVEGAMTHAHIHLSQKGAAPLSVWLCGTPANPGPEGTPTCPTASSGEVRGTVSASNVVGPTGIGVGAADFEQLLRAIREGQTYANVHTTKHPGGEIRGRIQ